MAERSLGDWLNHLERLHPKKIDLGLARVERVARVLGLLPFPKTVITVAGTNGKGSVVYACDALLRHAGRRTARYTSPHLRRYNERIAVDGRDVDDATIVSAFASIEAARGSVSLSYFEFSTLAALLIFVQQDVDVVILEVGLGGRLDAVNIVDCDVAVITSIDLDHQGWLGDTVEQIAPEKAAIARWNKPVILAQDQYPASLFETLASIGAHGLRAGDTWFWSSNEGELELKIDPETDPFCVPLPQGLRPENVAAAVRATACVLGEAFDPLCVAGALAELHVPARRQRIRAYDREFVLDVAHNPAAMRALALYLQDNAIEGQTFAALGIMADKDLASIATELASAVDGACALAIPGIERAQQPEAVWAALDTAGVAIPQNEFSAEAVLKQLLGGSAEQDRIVVCGSFHTVAAVLEAIERRAQDDSLATPPGGGPAGGSPTAFSSGQTEPLDAMDLSG